MSFGVGRLRGESCEPAEGPSREIGFDQAIAGNSRQARWIGFSASRHPARGASDGREVPSESAVYAAIPRLSLVGEGRRKV